MYVAPLQEVTVTRGGNYGGLRRHKGLDLVCASGTPVRAVIGGLFHSAGFNTTNGYWGIWHGDDGNYWNVEHLLRPFDARGRIEAGQVVAISGATGAVTGAHLHQGVSTIPSLTVGTFDPTDIIVNASPPQQRKTMLILHRTTQTTSTAQQMWVTGVSQTPKLLGLTTNTGAVEVWNILQRWITSPVAPFAPAENDQIAYWLGQTALTGGSGGGLTTAEHTQLFDIANKAELGQALTSAVALSNQHTDEKFNGLTLTTP